jgi:hypothetical protein
MLLGKKVHLGNHLHKGLEDLIIIFDTLLYIYVSSFYLPTGIIQ